MPSPKQVARSLVRSFELKLSARARALAAAWCDLYKVPLDVEIDPDALEYEGVREWLRDASPEQFGYLLRLAYEHGKRDVRE